MRNLLLMAGLTSLFGCQTVQKMDDVLAWTKDKFEKVDQKIETVKAEQTARLAKFEPVVGAFDRDGDGSVSASEAKAVVVEAAKTPEGRKMLLDPEFWVTITAAVAGLYGAGKAGSAGIKKLYHGPTQPTRRTTP